MLAKHVKISAESLSVVDGAENDLMQRAEVAVGPALTSGCRRRTVFFTPALSVVVVAQNGMPWHLKTTDDTACWLIDWLCWLVGNISMFKMAHNHKFAEDVQRTVACICGCMSRCSAESSACFACVA